MQLLGLKNLHQNMRQQNLKRAKFDFQYKNAKFKCLFFTDESPYWLILAIRGTNFFIKLDVKKGYVINPIIDREKLYKLIELLGLKTSNEKFSIKGFFEIVNSKIPNSFSVNNEILPFEIAPYIKVPESGDGVYFVGWIPHNGIKSNARPENLEKTRFLISSEAYQICKKKNISSRWSNDEKYKYNIPSLPS